MVQTFSIDSEDISRFLGTVLLNADRVAIVSPWVSDIHVRYPPTESAMAQTERLSKAIEYRNVDVDVFVDPKQRLHNWESAYGLLQRAGDMINVHQVPNLHAKAIITDTVLYQGSANMTYNGLNVNVELCDIRENELGDVDEFIKQRLGLTTS